MALLLRGDYNHLIIWFLYTFLNLFGAFFGGVYIYSKFRNGKRFQSVDVGVINLMLGCCMMSIACGLQCLWNFIGWSQYYQDWADVGCALEATMHVLAIMVQMLSMACVAYYAFRTVLAAKMSNRTSWAVRVEVAVLHAAFIWVYSIGGVLLTLKWSNVGLPPAGSYCFPGFTSPMLIWLAVTMILTTVAASVFYCRVFDIDKEVQEQVIAQKQRRNNPTAKIRGAARRTSLLMTGYALGWGFAPIACLWAWITGDITQPLELLVGIFGSMHSWFVPLIYGQQSQEVKKFIRRCAIWRCCPQCLRRRCDACFPDLEERDKNNQGEKTIRTRRYKSHRIVIKSKEAKTSTQPQQTLSIMSSMEPLPPTAFDPGLTIATDTSPLTASPNTNAERLAVFGSLAPATDVNNVSPSPTLSVCRPAWPV